MDKWVDGLAQLARRFREWLRRRAAVVRGWLLERSKVLFGFGASCIVVGLLTLAWATSNAELRVGALAMLVIVVGLLFANEWVRLVIGGRARLAERIGWALTFLGGVLAVLGIVGTSAGAAGVGFSLVVLGALPLAAGTRPVGAGQRSVVFFGLAMSIAGAAIAAVWLFIGLIVSIVGLAVYKRGLDHWMHPRDANGVKDPRLARDGRVELWIGTAATGAGLVLGVVAIRVDLLVLFPVATWIVFVGLQLVTISWPARGFAPFFDQRVVRWIGELFIVAGVFAIWSTGQSDLRAWVIGLAVAALGASIVWNGDSLVLFVIAAFWFTWVLVDRGSDLPADPHEAADQRIVAIGDSYISGEGAEDYFADSNRVGERRNECRRSPQAYPYLVAEELGMGLDFLACSGAKAVNVRDGGIPQMEAPDGLSASELEQLPYGWKVQIDHLRELDQADRDKVAVVLISLGGNDARFSEIAKGCLVPGSCDELRELWLGDVESLGPTLRDTYLEVAAVVPDAAVIVMPYPLMLNEDGCGRSLLDRREHAFLTEFVTVLNAQVRAAAAQAGMHYYEQGLFAFDGARICDDGRTSGGAMNFINLRNPSGDYADRLNPGTWVHGSMHPSPAGHELTAFGDPEIDDDGLVAEIRRILDTIDPEGSPNLVPDPTARFEVQGINASTPVLIEPGEFRLPIPCSGAVIDEFATRLTIFDEDQDDQRVDNSAAVGLVDVNPNSAVCISQSNGGWSVQQTAEGVTDITVEPSPSGDGDVNLLAYQDLDEVWQVRAIEYCSDDPHCPSDVGEWRNDQLATAIRLSTPPFVLLVLGGWLAAIGGGPEGFFRRWRREADARAGLRLQASDS